MGQTPLRSSLCNRLATVAKRSPLVQTVYTRARRRFTGHQPRRSVSGLQRPPSADADRLRRLLPELQSPAAGDTPSAEIRSEARGLATHLHLGDTDGLALEALRLLADRYSDRTAAAWLTPALAHAGHFAEAAERGVAFAPGRPRARTYVIVVTALHQLGRHQEAAELMRSLQQRFPKLSEHFVDIWRSDPLARSYRELQQHSPAHRRLLPVLQHLPFCAGTSMQGAFRQVVPWARELQISRRWGLPEIEQALQLPPEAVSELMLVRQHHPYPLQLPGRSLRHLTVLRDPVSQIRSGYYKRRQRDTIVLTRDTDARSFAEHVEYRLAHGLTNLLSRMLVVTHPDFAPDYRRAFSSSRDYTRIGFEEDMFWVRATGHLGTGDLGEDRLLTLCRETLEQNFAVVGTMTHLAASHLACNAAIGVPVAHRIMHRGRSGQPPADEGPVANRLREANAVDQQLFQEYTARFEREHAGLIRALEDTSDACSSR